MKYIVFSPVSPSPVISLNGFNSVIFQPNDLKFGMEVEWANTPRRFFHFFDTGF